MPTPTSLNVSLTDPNHRPLAWITGSTGLIGNYFLQTAAKSAPGWRVRGLTREHFDLLDFGAVHREFLVDKPQLIIHCAAVSTIAATEANPSLARQLNVELTNVLSELAAEIQFVLFSTDVVFDGTKGNYNETDAVNPLHRYGETKVNAELLVLRNPKHLVVRTSINGGISHTGNRGFNEQIRRAWESGKMMNLFKDEYRSAIPAAETARVVWEMAQKNCTGIFHVAGATRLSRWDIGQLLVKRWPELAANIQPASAKDYPGPARALDTSLNITKAQHVLSTPLPGLGEWLAANPHEPF